MGLDQWAYKTKREIKGTDFKMDNEVDEELAYWRKHPNLHGLMQKIYKEKGGKEEVFNMASVELTNKDLIAIGEKIINTELPVTSGFFFGESADEHYFNEDIEFLKKAKEAIKEGYKIFYTSWW